MYIRTDKDNAFQSLLTRIVNYTTSTSKTLSQTKLIVSLQLVGNLPRRLRGVRRIPSEDYMSRPRLCKLILTIA